MIRSFVSAFSLYFSTITVIAAFFKSKYPVLREKTQKTGLKASQDADKPASEQVNPNGQADKKRYWASTRLR